MSLPTITVFHCGDKDCAKAWDRMDDRSFGKFCKRLARDAELPCQVEAVETECLDRCDEAGCLCLVAGGQALWLDRLRGPRDRDRLLAALKRLAGAE